MANEKPKFNAWSVATWKGAMLRAMNEYPVGSGFTKEEIIHLAIQWLLRNNVPKDAYDPNKK